MKRINVVIAFIALALLVVVFVFARDPLVNIDDFDNEERILQDNRLPQLELDLRLQELKPFEPPREDELAKDAALDAMHEYTRAGLYGEALRISADIEDSYELDVSYFEKKGDLLVAMHQYRDAAEAYRSALLINKTSIVYEKIGDLYLDHSTKKKRSIAFYEEALSSSNSSKVQRELQIRIATLKSSL